MAYATSGETIKYTGRSTQLAGFNSPISTEDILGMIDDIYAEINGVVKGLDVVLPVSETDSPQAFALLRRLNTLGAAAMIELRLFGEASPGDARNARHTVLLEEYQRLLGMIQSGDALLSDADGGTISDADLASATGKFDSDGNLVKPFFKRLDQY